MEHGPTEPRRVTIEGTVYELVPWSLNDGRRWLYRIGKLMAPMLTSVAGASEAERKIKAAASIVAALEQLDEETFIAFVATCEKYTRVVGRDERGMETLRELSAVAEVLMRGKYFDSLELCRHHLQVQYADFFGRLVRQLAQLGANEAK